MSTGPDARPNATSYDVEGLVAEAWAGRIRVPRFQRDFRWGRQDVIRLFDSILRGYPIGSLLLWVRPAPAQDLTLGTLDVSAPALETALWVVDGQQRLTSLANALHESGARDPRFALAYDLRNRTVGGRPSQHSPWIIPLPVIFDLPKLIRWFAEHPEVADHLDAASAVTRTIRQFTVPAYQVSQHDERVLRDIFDRMNNYGKRLSRAEVFSALFADEESIRDERLTVDLIARRVEIDRGFGQIDDDTVLLAILARRGPNVMREIRNEFDEGRRGQVDFPGEDRDTAYQAGGEALRRAVGFLQDQAGVPHISFLPYRYLLVVLSRFFAHHPEPHPRNLRLLRRWFWRAAVTGPGAFAGGTTGGTRILCARIRPGDEGGSVQGLLQTCDEADARTPSLDRFRTNSAESKIILCSWWHSEPRSLTTGQRYERTGLSTLLADRATAAEVVTKILSHRQVPERHRHGAANRMLVVSDEDNRDELDSLVERRPAHLDEATWRAVLASHSLDETMVGDLAEGRFAAFLDTRQEALARTLRGFLARMCEWNFEDTPPLEDMILEDLDGDDDGHS